MTPEQEAFAIALKAHTWRDAVDEIVRRGLAEDIAEADELIQEGEADPPRPLKHLPQEWGR